MTMQSTDAYEPYEHGQFVEGKDSPYAGQCTRTLAHRVTASTVMVGTVEGILGMRPDASGLKVDPSISSDWGSYTVPETFRGEEAQHDLQQSRSRGERR